MRWSDRWFGWVFRGSPDRTSRTSTVALSLTVAATGLASIWLYPRVAVWKAGAPLFVLLGVGLWYLPGQLWRRHGGSFFAATGVAALVASTLNNLAMIRLGAPFTPFHGYKLLAFVVALLAPVERWAGLVLVGACGALPFVLSAVLRPDAIPDAEPWVSGVYVGIAGFMLAFRHRQRTREADALTTDARRAAFQSYVGTLQDGYLLTSLDGVVRMANDAAAEIFGYSRSEEVLERHFGRELFLDPGESERLQRELRASERKKLRVKNLAARKRDGTPLTLEGHVRMIQPPHDMPPVIEVVIRDITTRTEQHRQTEAALDFAAGKLAAHLQQTLLAVIEWRLDPTPDGAILRVADWNPAAEQLLGHSAAEAIGKTPAELRLAAPDTIQAAQTEVLQLGRTGGEIETLRKDGQVLHCNWYSTAIDSGSGQPTAVLSLVQDVTDRRRAEQELARLNEELEARVEQRTAALAEKNEELRQVERMRQGLIQMIVHDLKNPLTAALSGCSYLIDAGRLQGESLAATELVQEAAEQMHRMVLDILDVSESERGTFAAHRQPVALSALLQRTSALCELRVRNAERDYRAEIQELGMVEVDPGLIDRVIQNLVDNAIKYSRVRTTVELRARRVDGAVELSLRDEGAGIPPAERERIFEPYARLDSAPMDRSSKGLGLAFCRLAVHAHGGRIWVEDAEPRGALFRVQLPVAA